MRREDRDSIVSKVQQLAEDAEINSRRLGMVRLVLEASPETLLLIETAIGGGKGQAPPSVDLEAISIDNVEELSHQLRGVLKRKGYMTLANLNKPEAELREDGFQDRSIVQIRAALAKHGHTLE